MPGSHNQGFGALGQGAAWVMGSAGLGYCTSSLAQAEIAPGIQGEFGFVPVV